MNKSTQLFPVCWLSFHLDATKSQKIVFGFDPKLHTEKQLNSLFKIKNLDQQENSVNFSHQYQLDIAAMPLNTLQI